MKTLFNFYLIYTYNCKSRKLYSIFILYILTTAKKGNLQLATLYMT